MAAGRPELSVSSLLSAEREQRLSLRRQTLVFLLLMLAGISAGLMLYLMLAF